MARSRFFYAHTDKLTDERWATRGQNRWVPSEPGTVSNLQVVGSLKNYLGEGHYKNEEMNITEKGDSVISAQIHREHARPSSTIK